MALSFAQPQVERPGPVGAPPCRSLQPLRSGQPAARVGPFQLSSPAPASTRKKVVATASRRKTTASNNLDPLSRARPWSALPRCCVNIAVRVAPTEQASRASLFSWAWGRGCMPWICGHGAPRRGGGGSAWPVPTPTDDNNAWGRQGRKDGAYPPLPHAHQEPRRNEQGPGNLLPGPSGWSPRRRSYLSFHDCAAWSFPSGQASSRYGLPVFSSSASPSRR